jgi:hypothetical protein
VTPPTDPTSAGLKSARSEIRWPPRVSKVKLRRLYQADAQGIIDQALLDDVGITLLLRCQAILERQQLNSGGATPFFQEYLRRYPAARTPQQKMLAIDRLIHEFHYSLHQEPDLPTRSVGPNLIQGKLGDVLRFLDELTYGPQSTEGLAATRREWQDEYAKNMRMRGGSQLAEILLDEIEGCLGHPLEETLASLQAEHAAQPGAFRWTKVRIALELLLARAQERGTDRWVEKTLASHLPASVPDVPTFLTRIYESLYGRETGFCSAKRGGPKNPVSGDTK